MGWGTWANPLCHSQKPKHESLRRRVSALFSVLRGAFGRDFIKESAKGKNPFVSRSVSRHHTNRTNRILFDHLYTGKTFTKPANYGRQHGEHFSRQSKQGRQYERFVSWGYRDKYDQVMAIYHQMVHGVDAGVGMIRKAVKEAGIEKNTVFIFSSDNGFLCGSHGYGSKVLPYEESTNASLIIYDPRHSSSGKNLRSDALTANIDVASTILDLAGLEVPAGLDGVSLLPLLDNPKAQVRETAALINALGTESSAFLWSRDERLQVYLLALRVGGFRTHRRVVSPRQGSSRTDQFGFGQAERVKKDAGSIRRCSGGLASPRR